MKRFPERPPLFLTPYQSKILELIHEWKQTICVTSKHKEDYVHIRDMHRLLSYKGEPLLAHCKSAGPLETVETDSVDVPFAGYRFPNIDSRIQSVLNPENVSSRSGRSTPYELNSDHLLSMHLARISNLQMSSKKRIGRHKPRSYRSSSGAVGHKTWFRRKSS